MVARRESERPTLAPGFDVEQFARDSDRRMTSAAPAPISYQLYKERDLREDFLKDEALREEAIGEGAFADDPVAAPAFAAEEPGTTPAARFPAEESGTAPSAVRLVTRPRWGPVLTNEAWARSMEGSPMVQMTNDGLKRLPLDHRAGFVISLMDGSLDLDTIIELSGMHREEALTLVRDLYESGVVVFR